MRALVQQRREVGRFGHADEGLRRRSGVLALHLFVRAGLKHLVLVAVDLVGDRAQDVEGLRENLLRIDVGRVDADLAGVPELPGDRAVDRVGHVDRVFEVELLVRDLDAEHVAQDAALLDEGLVLPLDRAHRVGQGKRSPALEVGTLDLDAHRTRAPPATAVLVGQLLVHDPVRDLVRHAPCERVGVVPERALLQRGVEDPDRLRIRVVGRRAGIGEVRIDSRPVSVLRSEDLIVPSLAFEPGTELRLDLFDRLAEDGRERVDLQRRARVGPRLDVHADGAVDGPLRALAVLRSLVELGERDRLSVVA